MNCWLKNCVEAFGVFVVRPHARLVEDFEMCARIESEKRGGLRGRRGGVLSAP